MAQQTRVFSGSAGMVGPSSDRAQKGVCGPVGNNSLACQQDRLYRGNAAPMIARGLKAGAVVAA